MHCIVNCRTWRGMHGIGPDRPGPRRAAAGVMDERPLTHPIVPNNHAYLLDVLVAQLPQVRGQRLPVLPQDGAVQGGALEEGHWGGGRLLGDDRGGSDAGAGGLLAGDAAALCAVRIYVWIGLGLEWWGGGGTHPQRQGGVSCCIAHTTWSSIASLIANGHFK